MSTPETPLTTDVVTTSPPEVKEIKKAPGRYVELSVKEIITRSGDNIRSGELPDIEGLSASIASDGVIEPIIVTAATDVPGKYTVVAGHRRLTAVRSLGLPSIPALIIDADVDRRLRLALVENIQRVDMNPLDKAKGIAKLLKNTKLEQQEVAQALGVAPGFVSQYLAILELPDSALDALRDGKLSFTQARTLCRLLPNKKAVDDLIFENAADLTVAALDAKVSHLVGLAEKVAAETESEETDEDKPKKKKTKVAVPDGALNYYTEADFHPLKKEDIRELMVTYKRKEINADTAKKREEYKLILKGITLAADLRLK